MANPQKENGFTPIANEIVDELMKINLSAYEVRVLWFLFRKTYGWDKKSDWIALSQFSGCTKLDRRHIYRAIKELSEKQMITIEKEGVKYRYSFQKDYDKWDLSAKKTIHDKAQTTGESTMCLPGHIVPNGAQIPELEVCLTGHKIVPDGAQIPESEVCLTGHKIVPNGAQIPELEVCLSGHKIVPNGAQIRAYRGTKIVPNGAHTKETLTKEPLQKNFYKRNVVNDIVADDPPSLDPVSLEIPEKPKKEKPAKEKLPPDPEAVQLAAILFREIVKENPQSRLLHLANGDREKKIIGWAEDIDKLIRIDHQEFSIIEEVIIWTTQDSFWAANIQSGRKLRQKWDTLTTKMKHNENGSVNGRKSDDYRRFNGIREWLKEKEEETEARID